MPVDLSPWLSCGQIEQVICGGENYEGARPCDFDWVKALAAQCRQAEVAFNFIETGSRLFKDGRMYSLPSKRLQSEMAWKSGVSFPGRFSNWKMNMGQFRRSVFISLILVRIVNIAAVS